MSAHMTQVVTVFSRRIHGLILLDFFLFLSKAVNCKTEFVEPLAFCLEYE